MNTLGSKVFPPQKLSAKDKTEKWAIRCLEAGEDLALFSSNSIRESYENKVANYNLANDILNTKDIQKVVNPMGIQGGEFPAKMQNYPIINPKIDLLVGEERKRRFDWTVRVINEDAISQKEDQKKQEIFQLAQQFIQSEAMSEEDLNEKLKKLQKYHLYEFQDLKERTANHLLNYLFKTLNLKEEFNRGFEDALIAGEEIYCTDIVAGEPILRKVNPLNIFTVRSGESPWIEDSDIIVEDTYVTPGSIIDEYHDVLTDKQVQQIDIGLTSDESEGFINIGSKEPSFISSDGLIDIGNAESANNRLRGEYFDGEGNIRKTRILWKSWKKIGFLTYPDENGMPQETVVSETYKVNKELGEEIKWEWIREWWETTRLGKSIYVKMQPRPIQFRSMANLSKCNPGYTGLAYNINSSRAKSLMDKMKPYQYLYNVFMYRLELAFAKNKGKIAVLDVSQCPDHWTPEKWMYYFNVLGFYVKDSFKEANKGAAQGKLAGQMQQNNQVLDLETGNFIQQQIMMLQFLEQQVGQISGISAQRQGQIENRELVGNVERAVTQSSHITEKWFGLHSNVKVKALTLLLETAKEAYKEQKDKRFQYVLDDMSTYTLSMDGSEFRDADYGIIVTDGSTDEELRGTLKQLAQAGLQNDKLNFSQLIDIYMTPSMASMRRKLETAEEEKSQMMQDQFQQQQEIEQAKIQEMKENREDLQAHELEKLDRQFIYDKELKQMEIDAKTNEQIIDLNHNGVDDRLEQQKIENERRLKENKLEHDKNIDRQDMSMIEREKNEKQRLEKEKLNVDKESKAKDLQLKKESQMKDLQMKKESQAKILKLQAEKQEKELKLKKELSAKEFELKKLQLEKEFDLKKELEEKKLKQQLIIEKYKVDNMPKPTVKK